MWPLVRLHLPSRPATPHHWLLAALPTRASRLRAPPAAARCVPPDCANESDASSLLSLLATQQRATALAPTSAASQLIRNASLSTAHPFLAQQKPLQTHFVVYAFIRACFQHLLSPVPPAQLPTIIIFFHPCGPAGGVPPKAKKNTFPAGRQPSKYYWTVKCRG